MFLININEIFKMDFIIPYENLNNYIHSLTKYENITIELKNLKKIKNDNDKKLQADKNIKIIREQQKLKLKIKKINYKLNTLLIKNKNVELVRNNIIHSNLFFYNIAENELNNGNITVFNINKTFSIYLNNILNFYNNNINKKKYKKLEIDTNNLLAYKRMLLKQLSQLFLKKDYLFLLVPEETKNKKGEKSIKYTIHKLSISNENADTKEAFNNVIKAKIKDITQNPQIKLCNKKMKIADKTICGITVMKYKFYYFLKNILIKEINKIKKKDIDFYKKNC